MASTVIDAGVCERIITTVLDRCPMPTVQATPTSQPNYDGLEVSIGQLGVALTWGSIVLAVIAVVAIVGWGYFVKVWAEREAQKEAERCAEKIANDYLKGWLATEAPQIIRKHVDFIRDTSLGTDDDDKAAENIGKEAG